MNLNDQGLDLLDKEKCPRCGRPFICSKSGKCWCYEVSTPVSALEMVSDLYDGCLCPSCLREMVKIDKKMKDRYTREDFITGQKRKPGNQ